MPLYEYECKNGHVFDSREHRDTDKIDCPKCGQEAKRHSVYPVHIIGETVAKR